MSDVGKSKGRYAGLFGAQSSRCCRMVPEDTKKTSSGEGAETDQAGQAEKAIAGQAGEEAAGAKALPDGSGHSDA
jgi:hypothetical protein